MTGFQDRHVILGVTGSIAAFKAAALASELTKAGATVRTVMTAGAQRFVSRLTFEALTGQPVAADLWEEHPSAGGETIIGHIDVARWADVLVVAPASASSIARLALGIADDVLGALALATSAPLLVAPAMESHMYAHPATQANLDTLRQRGAVVVGPSEGRLASGSYGPGRMVEPSEIMSAIGKILAASSSFPSRHDLSGLRLVVSAGPTREPIDPVRYLSNRSSGKMGVAIARAAHDRGATVTLVAGPVETRLIASLPLSLQTISVETASEMCRAVLESAPGANVVIMAAAVADFRPAQIHEHKVKKSSGIPEIVLERTDDILEVLQREVPHTLRVGFAAETDDVVAQALDKQRRKGLAMVVANHVGGPDSPFESETNTVTLVCGDNDVEHLPRLPKTDVAHRILDAVRDLLANRPPT